MCDMVEAEVLWGGATAAEIPEAAIWVTKLICQKQVIAYEGH